MTLVHVTLDKREQDVLLKMADEVAAERGTLTPWESIGTKIRRARDTERWEHDEEARTAEWTANFVKPARPVRYSDELPG